MPQIFGQVLIYHNVAAVGAEKSQTDRRRLIYQLEFGRVGQRSAWIGMNDAAIHARDPHSLHRL